MSLFPPSLPFMHMHMNVLTHTHTLFDGLQEEDGEDWSEPKRKTYKCSGAKLCSSHNQVI